MSDHETTDKDVRSMLLKNAWSSLSQTLPSTTTLAAVGGGLLALAAATAVWYVYGRQSLPDE